MTKGKLSWLVAAALMAFGVGRPGSAAAEVILNFDFPLSTAVVNVCSGDLVLVDGSIHVVQTLTVSASGNVTSHMSSNGSFKGTGLFNGGKYTGGLTDSDHFHLGTGGCPILIDRSTRFRLNTKGGKNNLFVESALHISTNNACEVTNVELELLSASCK